MNDSLELLNVLTKRVLPTKSSLTGFACEKMLIAMNTRIPGRMISCYREITLLSL